MSEVWIPESFRERPYARERFRQIVAWASRHHPFYQRFCPGPHEHVPIISRADITDNNDLLLNGHPETGRTSGSTGVPVRISWSRLKSLQEQEAMKIHYRWIGPPMARARLISRQAAQPGEDFMDICRPVAEQADWLLSQGREHGALSVVTFPSNALQLAEHVLSGGLDCSFVTRLICYAESLDESDEPLLKAAFPNAAIWNNYSCSEVGFIALRCPHNPDYLHAMALNVGMEILDEDDRPCADGETGRVVVTDWFNRQSPFIRYDIGDMAEAGTCPCGQIPFPSMRRVLGKVRGFLKDRDGNRRIFANIGAELKKIDGLRQYQIIQDRLTELTVRYVINPGADDDNIRTHVADCIEDFLEFRPELRFRREAVIERERNGKFHATICRA